MKKVNFFGKLSLNKETIAKLNVEQMSVIKGGANAAPVAAARLSWFRDCSRVDCSSVW